MGTPRVHDSFMTHQRERATAEAQIRAATTRFLETAIATPDQWTYRASPGAWSMADVAEHVAISNRNLHAILSRRLLATAAQRATTDVLDAEIPYLFYRGDEPPNVGTPTGTWTDRADAMRSLEASVDALVDWCGGVAIDLRKAALAHPVYGRMDGIQWLQFAAAHTERHRAQLIGIRARASFPR